MLAKWQPLAADEKAEFELIAKAATPNCHRPPRPEFPLPALAPASLNPEVQQLALAACGGSTYTLACHQPAMSSCKLCKNTDPAKHAWRRPVVHTSLLHVVPQGDCIVRLSCGEHAAALCDVSQAKLRPMHPDRYKLTKRTHNVIKKAHPESTLADFIARNAAVADGDDAVPKKVAYKRACPRGLCRTEVPRHIRILFASFEESLGKLVSAKCRQHNCLPSVYPYLNTCLRSLFVFEEGSRQKAGQTFIS